MDGYMVASSNCLIQVIATTASISLFPVYVPCLRPDSAVCVRVPNVQLKYVVGVALMIGLLKCCDAEHLGFVPYSKDCRTNQFARTSY